jgi:predicted MPP superfamily phosphohydrolase
MKRRTFLKSLLTLAGGGLATGLYAWQVEPLWLEFVKVPMPIVNLPDYWKGKTIMQISDMHVGDRFDYRFLIESMEKAKAFSPDLVVYTGDFVNYLNSTQLTQLKEVMQYAVKGKEGTLGIMGNHDYGLNWSQKDVGNKIYSILEQNGIKMLRNERWSKQGLSIGGLDDVWGPYFEPSQVLPNMPAAEANILLCHNPDVCDMPIWGDYKGWILSGHTHGGQCKPPFLPPPVLPVKNKRYNAGIFKLDDKRTLYINRALGHLWQVRFNVRPEITIFNLNAEASSV